MQWERRGKSWWGVAASAAVHALLLGALLLASRRDAPAPEEPGALLQLALLPLPEAPGLRREADQVAPVLHPASSDGSHPETGAAGSPEAIAGAPLREAIRYFRPEEVDRQLIVLRDPAADQVIEIPHRVWLELFVDRQGRVAALAVHHRDGGRLAPRLAAQLRAAFLQLEFLPALRGGNAVPAYLLIELAPPES